MFIEDAWRRGTAAPHFGTLRFGAGPLVTNTGDVARGSCAFSYSSDVG